MAKISVRHGIARAYGFLVGRLFQVLGLSWLPAVFYAVAATFLIQRMSGAMQSAVPSDAGLLGEYALFYLVALVVVTAFLGAVIAVPLTREAMSQHDEWAAAHFVVGPREGRMFFALLRFYAVVILALVALAFAAGIAVTTAARYAEAQHLHLDWGGIRFQVWLNLGAALVAAAVFLVVAARLGFMLSPMAAAEKHVSLARAWHLSRGNFWRIAFTYLAVGLPAALLIVTCETSLGGLEMGKTLPSGMQAFYTVQHDHIAVFATILAAGLVVLQALFAGASASAYEELADAAAYETAPAAAPVYHEPAHEPAMAFADAGPRGFADARPTDHRFAGQREDLASAAAAEATMPVMMETPPVEYAAPTEPAEPHELNSLHVETAQSDVAHEVVAPQVEEHVAEAAPTVEYAEPVTEHTEATPTEFVATGAPAEAHADTGAGTEHAEQIIIEPSATEAPPLDPTGAMAATAPHEEYTPPG
jgi:hypothetical protein